MVYSTEEIERIAKVGFVAASKRRKKLCLVDKANVLETSQLWRDVVASVSKNHPDVSLEYMYVDNAAMQLIRNPSQFDVILTENLFGDILSDEASMVCGSIGLLPSASIGAKVGIYEPIHGSAPRYSRPRHSKSNSNDTKCWYDARLRISTRRSRTMHTKSSSCRAKRWLSHQGFSKLRCKRNMHHSRNGRNN